MYRIYQVKVDDTLDSVANLMNTSVDNLKKINGIKNNVKLIPGSFLIVPIIDDRYITYIVNEGDTIYSISKKYDVPIDLVLKINGLNEEDYIYPNQEIIIPTNNYKYYVTKEGDTIYTVMENLNIDYNTLLKNNDDILLEKDQVIIYKT